MLQQNTKNATTNSDSEYAFGAAIRELGISRLLKKSNISKARGNSVFDIFQFLLLLVFQKCNLFHFLNSKKKDTAFDDNTYYRFLNEARFNWRKFILLLATKVADYFSSLTNKDRVKCFVLDDSVIARNRSKKVELLSRVYNHVIHKTEKGFNLLLLGWTDGFSFLPVQYIMLASSNAEHILKEARKDFSPLSNGAKRRREAVMQKPDAAIRLIHNAVTAGIDASYVLMDTWFTNEPFIGRILQENLDVIGMLKDNKQQYWYDGKLYGLKSLATLVNFNQVGNLFGSLCVETKYQHIPVRLVFVRNRNKHSEYIVILSTDCTISDSEVVRIYGNRWNIELCFRTCKSLLSLGKEFQGLSYDLTDSSTALVLTRFIILEYLRRKNSDQKTICELFYVCCDDIQDMELETAIKQLVELFVEGIKNHEIQISEAIREKLLSWYISQPQFIRILFGNFADQLAEAA